MLRRHREVEKQNVHLKDILLFILGPKKCLGPVKIWTFVVVGAADEVEEVVYVREYNDQAEINLGSGTNNR